MQQTSSAASAAGGTEGNGGIEGKWQRLQKLDDEGTRALPEGPRVLPEEYIRVGCLQKKSIGTSGVFWSPVCICFRVKYKRSISQSTQARSDDVSL